MLAKFGTNASVVKLYTNTSGNTYNWPNLEPMQVAFFVAGEITQVKESIPWVRCASGNVFRKDLRHNLFSTWIGDVVRVKV